LRRVLIAVPDACHIERSARMDASFRVAPRHMAASAVHRIDSTAMVMAMVTAMAEADA
jgi:hypothetical protein